MRANHTGIYAKYNLFLNILGENLDAFDGLCNGSAYMCMRANLVGEKSKHIKRLDDFEAKHNRQIEEMAELYKKYIEKYVSLVKEEKAVSAEKTREQQEQEVQNKLLQSFNQENLEIIKFANEIYFFIHTLVAAQNPGCNFGLFNRNQTVMDQIEFNEILRLLPVDQYPNLEVKVVLEVALNFTKEELINLLSQNIQEGDHIYVSNYDHIDYVTKVNRGYEYYCPLLLKIDTVKALAEKIKNVFFISKGKNPECKPLAFTIFEESSNHQETIRPGRKEIMETIFARRAVKHFHAKSWDNSNAAHIIAIYGHSDTLALLIEKGVDLNLQNNNGETPLYLASLCGHVEFVKNLLAQNVLLNNQKSKNGWTAVTAAVDGNYASIVKELIEKGADVNIKTEDGETPLQLAVKKNYLECIALLLPLTIISDDNNLLAMAIENHSVKAIELLCESKKININAPINSNHETSLHLAIKKGNADLVRVLLRYGANAKIKDKNGVAALDLYKYKKPTISAFTVINNTGGSERVLPIQDQELAQPSKKFKTIQNG